MNKQTIKVNDFGDHDFKIWQEIEEFIQPNFYKINDETSGSKTVYGILLNKWTKIHDQILVFYRKHIYNNYNLRLVEFWMDETIFTIIVEDSSNNVFSQSWEFKALYIINKKEEN